jgi:hypothetical protein
VGLYRFSPRLILWGLLYFLKFPDQNDSGLGSIKQHQVILFKAFLALSSSSLSIPHTLLGFSLGELILMILIFV